MTAAIRERRAPARHATMNDTEPGLNAPGKAPTVPPGYKQTEVGLIPEDWEVKRLGDVAGDISRGASPRPIDDKRWFDPNSAVGWVRISDVTASGRQLDKTTQRLSPDGIKHSRFVPSGSLIMSICATVGRPIETALDVCIHDGFVVFDRLSVDQGFLFHRLKELEPHWGSSGQTGSQMNLNTDLIKRTVIPLPTRAEQEAIAGALSDADEWIESLEKLIEKKRAIKQGTMQALLTPPGHPGHQRLPGFEGEWEVKRLGEVLTIRHGRSQRDVAVPDGMYPILATGGQIGWTDTPLHCGPSVLIGRKGTIDDPQFMATPFWSVDTLFYSDIHPPNIAKFIYYRFCIINWTRYNEASGVPSLNARTIEAIEIPCPTPPEQSAISAALSDMDAEIKAVEAKLAKARQIKQGMMQELLTGRLRLV